MSNSAVAKRYALALFQLSKEHQLLDQMETELRVVKDVVTNNPGLTALLQSPKLSKDKKKEIVNEAFSSASPFVVNTLKIMIDRGRAAQLTALADEFIVLANEERGVAEADVYTTRPITADESKALSESFASKVGKKSLTINNIVDSNLLGGVKLRIGNRIFDGSLRGKLERLERTLLG
ncbi:F0F1 ATP synthase subunit delta [Bacillus sp. DNRA2]|uniref:F0F1 ATP synthase subunit delta n=1 Tax=Bacillus sp. DNRA2 TaxID=2723053 RepID=UPI00145D8B61|nr:F0F1 ATP synthase subunit delta [Bacillus sp. DNRA2]NMD70079.1 F0F1 ATP synthase subunit delta [Bacillus sp. DNRA2]